MSAYPREIPQPTQSLVITGRVCDTKYVFTPSNGTNVCYYILAPPKYNNKRHAHGWSAIVHAGDNPKYHSLAESPLVGRCKRSMFWRKYFIEYGGSVQKDVKKDEKAIKEKKLKGANRFRKWFCMSPKDLVWSEEEEAAISDEEKGVVTEATKMLELEHTGHRRYEFVVDGRTYRWSGTKMHAGSFINKLGLKGFAFHVKLVRMDDHKLIASFKKCYLGKNGRFGELNFYGGEPETGLEEVLIVQTAFCVTKAEKEKRDKVRDILEEIGENAEG
ncbi:uncharacterized protein H6S33_004348 [Morchella sextelata]|uniref:uncharacterized protein n=1 Tax=Morchella sextelata TaxID=1174677 RepID=UPI001D057920|nr:uncharacterized protein H6S33_004348 [Morchella sextelata]KAH0605891.1 hypothetical protein H6S33_004348 [Morchella sextelata]